MKAKSVKAASICLYFLCAVSLFAFLYIDFFGVLLSRSVKIMITAAVFVFGYAGSFIRCVQKTRPAALNIMYNTFFFLFTVYAVVIIDFTLIDGAFGRDISVFFSNTAGSRSEYIKNGVNLIPFSTVKLFINGYKNGLLSFADITDNILGNFLVLAPLSFFTRVFFKKTDRFYKFFVLVLGVVILIELLQLLFMTGYADIDDVILNISGAVAFYGILRIKWISRMVGAATFDLWETEQ